MRPWPPLSVPDPCDSWVFIISTQTEFLYCKLYVSETAKTITVFDVEGVGIRDLAGVAFEFLRRSSSLIQEHYPGQSDIPSPVLPVAFLYTYFNVHALCSLCCLYISTERSKVIMIVNAPSWFSFLWKMIRPMVNERTQKKVKICKSGKETTDAIAEFVDIEKVPKCYGGQLTYGDDPDSCRWNSPEEKALREHVYAINKANNVESKMS